MRNMPRCLDDWAGSGLRCSAAPLFPAIGALPLLCGSRVDGFFENATIKRRTGIDLVPAHNSGACFGANPQARRK
ncbi:hypothetical protein ACFOEY_01005 [Paracandidimonas soli]|uniref:hypothetical protein n=1 Tax=Paracandidimonas soli TaxID=1917182 RepID=UPI0036159512